MQHGAVSVWGEFSDGIWRIEASGKDRIVCVDGPFPIKKLGAVLNAFRPTAIALGIGGYGSSLFDPVHAAMFGELIVDLKTSLAEGCQ